MGGLANDASHSFKTSEGLLLIQPCRALVGNGVLIQCLLVLSASQTRVNFFILVIIEVLEAG